MQRSALQVLQNSNATSGQAVSTPFLDLTDVEIHSRQAGRETLRLNAARLALSRDLRTAAVTTISNGVAYAHDRPALLFTAGDARFQADIASPIAGHMYLSRVTGDTVEGGVHVHVVAPGLEWRWPNGQVQTTGAVQARVKGLGSVQCAALSVNMTDRSVSFADLQIAIPLSVLPFTVAALSSQPAKAPSEQIFVHASQSGHWDENHSTLTITGPVTVQQGNVTMRTVGVIYNNTTKVAHALAPVRITDDQNTLTGTDGSVDFSTHVATVTGDVHMSAIPSGGAKQGNTLDTEARQPTKLICDHISYNYRTKLADASGHLKVLQTTRTVTAETGHYDANAQIIVMNGNVDARSTDGKHLTAPQATVSVKPDDEWIEVKGPITYEFGVSEQDNPLPPTARSKGTGSAPSKSQTRQPPAR